MAQTAMAQAFERKGFSKVEVEFSLALAKYQNNGGTYEFARAKLDAAYGKGSGGRSRFASDGRLTAADAPQGEAGRDANAAKVGTVLPASPTERSTGRSTVAEQASSEVPVAAHRRNLPGHAKRGIEAIAAVQPALAKAAFASIRLPDGRSAAEVRWGEAPALAQKYGFVSRLLIAAHRYAIPADPTTPLGECVPADEQQHIVKMMERINAI